MGKGPPTAQNDEVPSDTEARDLVLSSPNTASSPNAAAPSRQRPEEILAHTLSATSHPEATDGWSQRGRRIFLIAMAAAGVILVVAGLLVTKELAPGPRRPAPLETGPGNGLANQLLQSAGDQGVGPQPAGNIAIPLPLPSTPTSRPAGTTGPSSSPAPPAPQTQPNNNPHTTAPPSTQPPSPTTTIPCTGLLGQSLQQVQLPCNTATRSSAPLG